MKNIINNILFFLIFIFAFTLNVYADNSCSHGVSISETSVAASTGWSATLPVCGKMKFEKYVGIGTKQTYPEAAAIGEEMVKTYSASVDNKSVYTSLIPRCNLPNAYISNDITYTGTYESRSVDVWEGCTQCTANKRTACNGTYAEYIRHDGIKEKKQLCTWVAKKGNVKAHCEYVSNYQKIPKVGYCSSHHFKYDCWKGGTPDEETGTAVSTTCRRTYTVSFYDCVGSNYYYLKGSCHKIASAGDQELKDSHHQYIQRDIAKVKEAIRWRCASEGAPCVDDDITLNYTFYCPLYSCTVWDETMQTCTPTFSVGGQAAYCVNPSDPFSATGANTANYEKDTTFEVGNCKSSYNTVDCGYSNILIEGNYYGLNYKSIELGLRLWAVHTNGGNGGSGFGGTGLSNRKGANCSQGVYYMTRNGVVYNVYKQTYRHAMNNFFTYAHNAFAEGYLNPKSDTDGFSILCSLVNKRIGADGEEDRTIANSSMYGVACGGTTTQKQGIALLFNTILGNKYMNEHLYGENVSKEPINAYYQESKGKGTYDIVVQYEEEKFDEVMEEVLEYQYEHSEKKEYTKTVDCTKLKKGTEIYEKIAPYCQTRTVLLNKYGQEITQEQYMQQCIKDFGCKSTEKLTTAVCDYKEASKQPHTVRIKYTKHLVGQSVNKFISCSGRKNQFIYSLDSSIGNGYANIDISRIREDIAGQKDFEINLLCNGMFCTNYELRKSGSNSCNNDLNNYNGKFSKSIKDPSLKCILNMRNETEKSYYDYSEYFHVNTDLCRIYCSDEVSYYLADKVTENSSRNFLYKIDVAGTGFESQATMPISSYIREKRTCVSEIYYNTVKFRDPDSIRKRYDLSLTELPPSSNWQTLVGVLKNKAARENYRGENINQLVYDLYNCNLVDNNNNDPSSKHYNDFGDVYIDDNKQLVAPISGSRIVKKPSDNKTGITRKYINKQYSASNNYGLVVPANNGAAGSGCELKLENGKVIQNTCITHSPIEYHFGSEVDGKVVNMESISGFKKMNIKYCNGENCFDYKKYDSRNYTGANANKEYKYTSKDPTRTNMEFNLSNLGFSMIHVPTNDYVFFDMSLDVGFYNNSTFEVEPDTGIVYYEGKTGRNYMVNDAYTYPVGVNAYNECKSYGEYEEPAVDSTSEKFEEYNEKYHRCEITQEFHTFATFKRKNEFDSFTREVATNDNAKKFSCYVDVKKPNPIESLYTNVDPKNMFPSGYKGDNWKTEAAEKLTLKIEKTAEQIRQGDKLLDYRITLTPSQINNLKEYNKSKKGDESSSELVSYTNESLVEGSCKINKDEKIYLDCRSAFLDILRKNGGKTDYGNLDFDIYGKKREG